MQPRLQPNLIPDPLLRRSVYRVLRRNAQWTQIRDHTRESAQSQCEICGEIERRMYCHEDWHYDDQTYIATLRRFMWICQDCNGVLHIGGGPVSWSGCLENDPGIKILTHIMQVNDISLEEALRLLAETNRLHEERSKHKWAIEVSQDLLSRFPFLKDVQL